MVADFHLTRREAEVLHWLSMGKTNRDISNILGISARTIDKHVERIFGKLGVETRTAAALKYRTYTFDANEAWTGRERRRADRQRGS